jgi:hypothetical protein
MKLFIAKLILKLVYLKKNIVLKDSSVKSKSALISYVLFPNNKIEFIWFYRIVHNRFYVGKLIANALLELGYDVYVYDYLNEDIDYSIKYDLFFGHNKTFSRISSKLSKGCIKVLITTGCSPEFDNDILRERQKELSIRKGTNVELYSEVKNVEYAKENFKIADHIFMLGNLFTKSAWYDHQSVFHYHNVYLGNKKLKKNLGKRNFLFIGSNLQLRRGLDLILDVFGNLAINNKVYVCGPYEKELEFVKLYKNELFESKNIIPLGYVNIDSKVFNDVVNECTYVIYPSCSEAESSSVLNMMARGLLPIIPDNVGFDNVNELGIKIKGFSISDVEDAVIDALNLTDQEILEKQTFMYACLNKFSTDSFVSNLKEVVIEINTK